MLKDFLQKHLLLIVYIMVCSVLITKGLIVYLVFLMIGINIYSQSFSHDSHDSSDSSDSPDELSWNQVLLSSKTKKFCSIHQFDWYLTGYNWLYLNLTGEIEIVKLKAILIERTKTSVVRALIVQASSSPKQLVINLTANKDLYLNCQNLKPIYAYDIYHLLPRSARLIISIPENFDYHNLPTSLNRDLWSERRWFDLIDLKQVERLVSNHLLKDIAIVVVRLLGPT